MRALRFEGCINDEEGAKVDHPGGGHPCFDRESAQDYARVHLPVAPACNLQCRFCNRKYSCANESRPGVTAELMSPRRALEHLQGLMKSIQNVSVVGIAGPGDPFANPERTLETLALVRRAYPDLMLCVASNGLDIARHIEDLVGLGVTHATITVNAVEPEIGKAIYEWIGIGGERARGSEAAAFLWKEQRRAIEVLSGRGIVVKANTVYIPGLNDAHVEEVARGVAEAGASIQNILPLIPTEGTAFADFPVPDSATLSGTRLRAARFLPQMGHCARCRADAAGLIGEPGRGDRARNLAPASTLGFMGMGVRSP